MMFEVGDLVYYRPLVDIDDVPGRRLRLVTRIVQRGGDDMLFLVNVMALGQPFGPRNAEHYALVSAISASADDPVE